MHETLISDLPPPLLNRTADKMPCFSLREAVKFWPQYSEDFIYSRLRGLAERRLIHQRRRRGSSRTSTAEYGADDFAAAAALMAFYDMGISDTDIVAFASLALYSWDRTLNPPPGNGYPYPLAAALLGVLNRGEFWTLRVGAYFHDQTGERRLLAACLPDEKPLNFSAVLDPAYLPRGSISIILPPLFLPFARAFK
jgi:hypothetical protein